MNLMKIRSFVSFRLTVREKNVLFLPYVLYIMRNVLLSTDAVLFSLRRCVINNDVVEIRLFHRTFIGQ